MSTLAHDAPHRSLWRTPRIRGEAFLGLFAQLTQGAAPISLVLVVRQASGSLAEAGLVSAAFWIVAAAARPVQGRLIDRRGTRLVMLICGPLHAAALISLVAAAQAGGGLWLLVVLSGLSGSALPPVSSSMRVDWGRRLPADERTAAYSVVYLTQEMAILIGPLLVAAVVAVWSAGSALVVAAAISGGATLAYGAFSETGGSRRGARVTTRSARSTAMPALLGATFLVGMTIGALQVATPALALARHAPALGGVLMAALSVGGVIGAVLYAGRRWGLDPSARLLCLLCVVGVAATPLALAPPLIVVGVLLAFVGVAVNPVFTTTSLLVDRHSAARAAESFGWMSTAVGGGTAAGNAVAGALAQHTGVPSAFLSAAVSAYCALLIATLARGRLSRAPADVSAITDVLHDPAGQEAQSSSNGSAQST